MLKKRADPGKKSRRRRICPKCCGSMKRDDVFTQRHDFWLCKRCGFWGSVPRK